jgi:hypothetical protein
MKGSSEQNHGKLGSDKISSEISEYGLYDPKVSRDTPEYPMDGLTDL